ncbi:collagen alpha-5(VI) chain-like [Ruditapes philippinarum]|uniref:collagen alpha-5(VI) chain-like n=1 Tax=Ruditapes philippinarum TaxID=129788 RepID=UPI00295BF300|nr:collagen alpha-5(VI) chain-like [Ruditapes philippinarum]
MSFIFLTVMLAGITMCVMVAYVDCYVEPTECFQPKVYHFITEKESRMFIKVHRGRRSVDCTGHIGVTVNCYNENSCECNKAACSQESDREYYCHSRQTPCSSTQICYLKTPCPVHWETECGYNACLSNPCKNDATCTDVGILSYACKCRSGYGGKNCDIDTYVDVVFLIDTSESQSEATLFKQRQYVKNFISSLSIGPNDFQIAIVTCSLHASVEVYLNSNSTVAEMTTILDSIQSDNGPSFIGECFMFLRTEIFTSEKDARYYARKFVIVLSDGLSSNPTDTVLQAGLLKQTGIDIFAVATGDQINHKELSDVATHWDKVFSVMTDDVMHTIFKTPITVNTANCDHRYSDLSIMFDRSMDISPVTFYEQISAVGDLLKTISLGSDNVHVSLYQYSNDVDVVFNLDEYFLSGDMVIKLNGIAQSSENGNTTNALKFLQHAFVVANGARTNVRKIALLVTSGHFEKDIIDDLMSEAKTLKDMDVILGIVSVGMNANISALSNIASDPAVVYVIGKELDIDYSVLYTLNTLLEYDVCEIN